jgi:hypothetical protein
MEASAEIWQPANAISARDLYGPPIGSYHLYAFDLRRTPAADD